MLTNFMKNGFESMSPWLSNHTRTVWRWVNNSLASTKSDRQSKTKHWHQWGSPLQLSGPAPDFHTVERECAAIVCLTFHKICVQIPNDISKSFATSASRHLWAVATASRSQRIRYSSLVIQRDGFGGNSKKMTRPSSISAIPKVFLSTIKCRHP